MPAGIINRNKEVALSIHRLKELLDYDPATGIFTWKVSSGKRRPGSQAGTLRMLRGKPNYIVIFIDGALFMAHRLAWFYIHGQWPYPYLDHKNMDKTDTTIDNLRISTRAQNAINMGPRADNKSGIKGVSWSKQNKKWIIHFL